MCIKQWPDIIFVFYHHIFQVHSSPCCDSHPSYNFIMNVADTLCEGHTDWIGATIPVGLWTIFCVIKYFPTTSAIDRVRGPGTERSEVDKDGELYSSFHIMKGPSLLSFLISWMFDLKTFQIHSGIEPLNLIPKIKPEHLNQIIEKVSSNKMQVI